MLFLGGDFENSFDQPFNEAIPLADKPHLLKPKATKEELFGRVRGSDSKGSSCQATSVLPDHMSLVGRLGKGWKIDRFFNFRYNRFLNTGLSIS